MQLPILLREAIEEETSRFDIRELSQAYAALSESYRNSALPVTRHLSNEIRRATYLAVRLPATYSVAHAVLTEARRLLPNDALESLLDLGAGPGTIAWAAEDLFKKIDRVIHIESDRALITLGKSLAAWSASLAIRNAEWKSGDIRIFKEFPETDMICASYALNEISMNDAQAIARRAWQATRQALVIIEPGTVKGFEIVRSLREELIRLGAHIIAPCPHQNRCPMSDSDWCHFSARVVRTALHRQIKAGRLGYEDEKYSYLIAARTPSPPAAARILRHPEKHSGFIRLELCEKEERMTLTVTRSDKENWKKARKIGWGDSWD